jgi:cysteine desulfurase
VFTGSGSEANLLALRGSVLAPSVPRSHIITQATEHPAVLATCEALARHHGTRVSVLPVRPDGLVEAALLEQLLEHPESAATAGERTIVSVMAANNETGALQPLRELSAIAHAYGALVHCDAAQAAGKIPLDVDGLDVDLLSVVGHKMYAPKGIAALYVRAGLELEPVVYGGGQEGTVVRGPRASRSSPPSERRPDSLPTTWRTVWGSGCQRFATGSRRGSNDAFPVTSG